MNKFTMLLLEFFSSLTIAIALLVAATIILILHWFNIFSDQLWLAIATFMAGLAGGIIWFRYSGKIAKITKLW